MDSAKVVVLVLVLLVAGFILLLIAVPVGLVVLFMIIPPTNTTIEPSTLTIYAVEDAECTVGEYCDVQVADAYGGQEPYSYQSDSYATGAPPMGMIVDLNGHLKGTPTREGDYEFGVCVADAVRDSDCTQAEATVWEAEAPVVEANAEISSFSCRFKYKDTYGDKHYELSASGTAGGPPGAELQLVFNPGYFTEKNPSCPDCRSTCDGWGPSDLQTCARGGGPESIAWTVYVPASQVMTGATLESAGYEVALYARIFQGDALLAEDVAYATCPR